MLHAKVSIVWKSKLKSKFYYPSPARMEKSTHIETRKSDLKQKFFRIEGWSSVLLNTILFAGKYWAGISTGSLALIADAWHTLTDSVSSIIVLIGGSLSRKPADEDHPFGHGRIEHITAIIIGVLLAIVAFDFMLQATIKLGSREATVYNRMAWIVTIISIIVKEGMAQFAFYAARRTQSAILKADGWHHRTDALSSILILTGLLIGQSFWWTDALLSFIVATMIAYASYEILSKEVKALMGIKPSDELVAELIRCAEKATPMQVNMHHINLHTYGDHIELSCHIKLPPKMSLQEAHDICTDIEKAILVDFGYIATVHPEPL